MTRLSLTARLCGGIAIVATLASCQGSAARPATTAQAQVQFNADGTIPTCRADLVSFTTQVRVVGSPHTTSVEITSILLDRGRFACALPQPTSACFGDPTAEVVTAAGHLVWSPRNLVIPCPARLPDAPPVVALPGQALDTTQTWDLTLCAVEGCITPNSAGGSALGVAAPGTYVARGTSDTVGVARGATFRIR